MFAMRRFLRTELGQDVIEYALLCALMAFAGAGMAVSVSNNIGNAFHSINTKNQKAHGNGGEGNEKGVGNQKH